MRRPESRQDKIARLSATSARGRLAEQQQAMLGELVQAKQQKYLASLMAKTRASGEVETAEVWKLVALDDVASDLRNEITFGIRAARELEALEQETAEETSHG